MKNISANGYTANEQLTARLRILRKIIAFVFAINLIIVRLLGGFATEANINFQSFAAENGVAQTYYMENVYQTELPSVLSDTEFRETVESDQSAVYDKMIGDVYNDVFGYAADFNLFTEGDCKITQADCGGRMAVGGDLNVTANGGWYDINTQNRDSRTDPDAAASLIVGGTANVLMNEGNVWANNLGNFNHNMRGQVVVGGIGSEDSKFSFEKAFEQLRASSEHLASLPANGTYSGYGYVELNGYEKINVFTFTAEEWNNMVGTSNNFELKINVPEGSKILINIVGGDENTTLNLCLHTILNAHRSSPHRTSVICSST